MQETLFEHILLQATDATAENCNIADNPLAEKVGPLFVSLKEMAKSVKGSATNTKVNMLLLKIKNLNRTIKQLDGEDALKLQLRVQACSIVRDVVVTLHNTKLQTPFALTLAQALHTDFKDIPSLQPTLAEDVNTLNMQLAAMTAAIQEQAIRRKRKKQLISRLIFFGIFFLILGIAFGMSKCKKASTKDPYVFTQEATTGDAVYADIVSIVPEYEVHPKDSLMGTHIICKCQTTDGQTIWVYISKDEYNASIDPEAKLGSYIFADFEPVVYSPAKRIHGTAQNSALYSAQLATKVTAKVLAFESIE